MEIALLGGTGDIGEGLALRIARDTDHDVVIGSRDPNKAQNKAAAFNEQLSDAYAAITGESNPDAATGADIVVLSVPPAYIADTIESVHAELTDDTVVVCPAVQMTRDSNGFHTDPPDEGSVLEHAAALLPAAIQPVGAFQNAAAGALKNLDNDLDIDIIVLGDAEASKQTVNSLIEEIDGLRAIDAGGIANASEVEGITPVLINLAINNDGMHDLGVRFQ